MYLPVGCRHVQAQLVAVAIREPIVASLLLLRIAILMDKALGLLLEPRWLVLMIEYHVLAIVVDGRAGVLQG